VESEREGRRENGNRAEEGGSSFPFPFALFPYPFAFPLYLFPFTLFLSLYPPRYAFLIRSLASRAFVSSLAVIRPVSMT
jgi:hypothetical protein